MAEHGRMDITQHRRTYAEVMTVTKWSTVLIIIALILLAIFVA